MQLYSLSLNGISLSFFFLHVIAAGERVLALSRVAPRAPHKNDPFRPHDRGGRAACRITCHRCHPLTLLKTRPRYCTVYQWTPPHPHCTAYRSPTAQTGDRVTSYETHRPAFVLLVSVKSSVARREGLLIGNATLCASCSVFSVFGNKTRSKLHQ